MDTNQLRQQAVLRRRIVTSLSKQDAEESKSKKEIRTTYKSASSLIARVYACLILAVLLIGIGIVYVMQPSLFASLYNRFLVTPTPSIRIRLLGHFPPDISPRKDLPPFDGGGGIGMGGIYSICTPENAPTRKALHQIRSIQSKLCTSSVMQDVLWAVQEVPPSEQLLLFLHRHKCIAENSGDGSSNSDAKFLELPRHIQVDWAQWCSLTVSSSTQRKKDARTRNAVGMLNFDTMRNWEFLQPLSALVTTTAKIPSSTTKEYHHSNLVILEAPQQISVSLFVFLGEGGTMSGTSFDEIAKQVVQRFMGPQLSMNHDDTEGKQSISSFLFELLEPHFSNNKEEWIVGRMIDADSVEDLVLQSDDSTEEVVLARKCDVVDGSTNANEDKTTTCHFMVVPQLRKKSDGRALPERLLRSRADDGILRR